MSNLKKNIYYHKHKENRVGRKEISRIELKVKVIKIIGITCFIIIMNPIFLTFR